MFDNRACIQERLPQLLQLLEEILPLDSWKEIDKRFVAFRRRTKIVPKKNVIYHMYKAQEVNPVDQSGLATNCSRVRVLVGVTRQSTRVFVTGPQ